MKEIIKKYINYMSKKHNTIAAMVVGSYVTGNMGSGSDIDLFFIGTDEFGSMRGREYYEGVEFEYFISPEWKYYDRLKSDKIAMRIYATSKLLLDPENKLKKIQQTAIDKIRDYSCDLSVEKREDYTFWLETIQSDGVDLIDKGDYSNALFFMGTQLQQMNELLCTLNSTLPTYNKYGVKEITEVDATYGDKLKQFMETNHYSDKKKCWIEMCDYIKGKLGNHDIKNYERHQKL